MAEPLRYPLSIIDKQTDYLQVDIYEYSPGSSGNGGKEFNLNALLSSSTQGSILNSIILPIPSNIQDGNSVNYGEDSLNSLSAAGVNIARDLMNLDFTDPNVFNTAFTKIQNAANAVIDIGSANKDLIMKALAAQAVNVFGGNVSVDSLLARESGQILNPNMELLFSGVTLRTFRFSFKMTPRDDKESKSVKNIIRTFKKNMAAKGNVGNNATGNVYLKTPNVFKLAYKKGNQPHPFLNSFKDCFLKDMSVNYAGENVYATYADGTPVSLTMDLTFQELFPIYADDYEDEKDNTGRVTKSGPGGVGY